MGKKQYDDDDGRVVASMNVEGMPWYHPKQAEDDVLPNGEKKIQMNRSERFSFVTGVFMASLLIASVFAVAAFVVIFLLTRAA